MKALKLQYIEDELGEKVAVILPVDDYKNMLKRLEELENNLKKMSEESDITEWHKDIVKQRLEEYRKNPGSSMDFDSAMADIEKEL